jgi:hypothetical protein
MPPNRDFVAGLANISILVYCGRFVTFITRPEKPLINQEARIQPRTFLKKIIA